MIWTQLSGLTVHSVASQLEGFKPQVGPGVFLYRVCMFCLCLDEGFSSYFGFFPQSKHKHDQSAFRPPLKTEICSTEKDKNRSGILKQISKLAEFLKKELKSSRCSSVGGILFLTKSNILKSLKVTKSKRHSALFPNEMNVLMYKLLAQRMRKNVQQCEC